MTRNWVPGFEPASRAVVWGYLLAPTVLGGMVVIGLGIIAVVAVFAFRDVASDWGVAVVVGVLVTAQLIVLGRFLASVRLDADLAASLRGRARKTRDDESQAAVEPLAASPGKPQRSRIKPAGR